MRPDRAQSRRHRVAVLAAYAAVGALSALSLGGIIAFVVAAPSQPAIVAADGVNLANGMTQLGIPIEAYIAFRAFLELALVGTSLAAALLLLAQRPLTGIASASAIVISLAPAATGVGAVTLSVTLTGSTNLQLQVGLVAIAAYVCLAYVFPDGSLVPRWTAWAIGFWVLLIAWGFAGSWWNQIGAAGAIASALMVALVVVAAFAQIYRYRRVSSAMAQRQTKWVAAALIVRVAYLAVMLLLPLVIGPLQEMPAKVALPLYAVTVTFSYLLAAVTAFAIAIAVLRLRLFDADVWLTRAISYGALTVAIVGVYVVVVGAVGLLWPEGDVALAVAATAIAALALHPLRVRLGGAANRLVYGTRDDPYTLLARLAERLAAAETTDVLLGQLTETVVAELAVERVDVVLHEDDGEPRLVARAGGRSGSRRQSSATATDLTDSTDSTEDEHFPLRFAGVELGEMRVALRPGTRLRPQDRRLLTDLAAGAATAVHVARTTEQLRLSQAHLISAHESERRRLGRELHDGVGPSLAGLHLRVDTALSLFEKDPQRSAVLLVGVRDELTAVIEEVRRIVSDLRPRGPDDVGLVEALTRAVAVEGLTSRPAVKVEAESLPRLPGDIELAVYRIVIEAVTNARRHAVGARECVVSIKTDGSWLRLSVSDDGPGIPADADFGVGVGSMRERAREVGGALTVGAASGGGTAVVAELPLRGAR